MKIIDTCNSSDTYKKKKQEKGENNSKTKITIKYLAGTCRRFELRLEWKKIIS